jgi:hypothetical protein
MLPRLHHLSITEKRKTTMASKDNKHKYANDTEEETPLKKQRLIGDNKSDDNDGDSSSSTDDFLSELEEVVSSEEEEMNLPAGSKEKLLIRCGCSYDGDSSDSEDSGSTRNGGETFDDGDTFNNEEEQFSDHRSTFN